MLHLVNLLDHQNQSKYKMQFTHRMKDPKIKEIGIITN